MNFELHKTAAAVVLLAAASWSATAHAATQSTAAPSLFPDASSVTFTLPPVAALENSPVHVYLTGYVGGYARCNDPAGCGAFTAEANISLSFTTSTGLSYYGGGETGLIDYAASEYGDFIDFTPVKFSTPVLTLSYSEALSYGLVKTSANQDEVHGHLSLNGSSFYLVSGSPHFDITDVAALTPKINLHYVADPSPKWNTSPVPEPSTAVMGLLGLAALTAVRRRAARRG